MCVDRYQEFQEQSLIFSHSSKVHNSSSLQICTHTHRNSASNTNTYECRCGYNAQQTTDSDISVQHNVHGKRVGGEEGRGKTPQHTEIRTQARLDALRLGTILRPSHRLKDDP